MARMRALLVGCLCLVACGTSSNGGPTIEPDAGASDAGPLHDAGTPQDAGQPGDAGTPTDAGSDDAGMGPVTFDDVFQLLQARCGGCHYTNDGDFDVSTTADAAYASLVNQLAARAFCGNSARTRVIPNDPTNSLVYQKVSGTQDCGMRMPWHEVGPSNYLSSAQQQIIHDWIANGAAR